MTFQLLLMRFFHTIRFNNILKLNNNIQNWEFERSFVQQIAWCEPTLRNTLRQRLIYICPEKAIDDTAKRGGYPALVLYRDPLRSLTLLFLNVFSQKS